MSAVGRGRFFLPGPTEVHPDVLAAQAAPLMGHRGAGVQALMAELQEGLRTVFRTDRPVLVSTSSATGLMEAGVRNAVGRRVLCLVNGAFSARFVDIARACGREVDVLDAAWGEAHDAERVRERVRTGAYDAVTLVHSETSTGALNPVPAIAAAVAEASDALVVVDSVTGCGGAPLETDAWGLDFVLTGSQKALALPPGLAFAVASPAMLERARSIPDRGYYFDLIAFMDNLTKHQTPTTPALTLMYAARAQLARIRDETMEARWRRHRAMADACHRWTERMRDERGVDVRVLAPEGARSPTVTCLRLPEGRTGPRVVADMRERGWVIGGGYGQLKDTTVRIGHMGDHEPARLDELLADLAEAVA